MGDCVGRALFLPDVLVPETMVLDMSLSGGTVYRLTIGKGSWFANALVFWLFICDQLGADILNVYEEERGIVITPADEIVLVDGDFDPIESQVGGMFGLEDCYLPHSFFPSLPLAQYDKSTAAIDGSSRRAHNGTAYTVSGITQQMRTLKVLLDYRTDGIYQNDLLQRAKWLNLWRLYWRQGRSVSCYPIQDIVVTFGEILWNTRTAQWGDQGAGRFESLQIPIEPEKVWKANKLVETRTLIDIERESGKFYVRHGVPMSEQNQVLRLLNFSMVEVED